MDGVIGVVFLAVIIGRLFSPIYPIIFEKPLYTHLYFSLQKLSSTERNVLQTEVDFYKKLSEKHKRYFEHRVAVFLQNHPIVSRGDLVITSAMKVLVASSSVALTFGLQRYTYRSFNLILIYPDIYYSTVTKQYHKGEFNPKNKVVVFSWKYFLEGFHAVDDNLNLGLHEFAHALHFEMKLKGNPNAKHFRKYFLKILLELKNPEKIKKLNSSSYFRNYAFENKYEFLAVLIETYFETPEKFKNDFPNFYQQVQKMLNQ